MRNAWVCMLAVWAMAFTLIARAEDDVRQIEDLYARWRTAVQSSDIAGYVAVLHPDVRLLPPGAPAIDGADNYAGFLVPVFASATYSIHINRAPQVQVVGDVAIAEYDYTIELTPIQSQQDVKKQVAEGALTDTRTSARYFDVLRRTDGQWRVWRHSWAAYK